MNFQMHTSLMVSTVDPLMGVVFTVCRDRYISGSVTRFRHDTAEMLDRILVQDGCALPSSGGHLLKCALPLH